MKLTWSWKWVAILAALAGLWVATACDDDGGDGDGDGDVDGDGDGDGDGDTDGDADGDGDADPTTCAQATVCLYGCAGDMTCAEECGENLCGPQAHELVTLLTCVGEHCTDCGDTCETCVTGSCPVEILACYTSSCVEGERSCGEAIVCLAGCGTDTTCRDECVGSVCPGGSTQIGNLMTCVDDNCATDCADLSSGDCNTCLQRECAGPSQGCILVPCEA